LILGYFLFRLIFNLILPIVRSTKAVRQQFARMQEEARPGQGAAGHQGASQNRGSAQSASGAAPKPTPNWDKMGDYIDFEEVK